jgi:hypothetical protein
MISDLSNSYFAGLFFCSRIHLRVWGVLSLPLKVIAKLRRGRIDKESRVSLAKLS